MILIVCVDKNGGMTFNSRRQSQDIKLRERILTLTSNSSLLMNNYSREMFGDHSHIRVDEHFLNNALDGDYCFAEVIDVTPYKDKISKIILYKWNMAYPSDLKFGISLSEGWKLVRSEDFQGNSHENITEEIYERVK